MLLACYLSLIGNMLVATCLNVMRCLLFINASQESRCGTKSHRVLAANTTLTLQPARPNRPEAWTMQEAQR